MLLKKKKIMCLVHIGNKVMRWGMLLLLFGGAFPLFSQSIKKIMKVAVWDTYVKREDGRIMHFDIIAPAEIKDTAIIFKYGKEYLESKGIKDKILTSKECRFCHIETVKTEWKKEISKKGYYIYAMENCD